ncbi:MAG: acyl-CoA thioesterase [Thermoplasmata archaeon]|nr:acyl-CoA thioesterase [Thermoplasmata archaeon]
MTGLPPRTVAESRSTAIRLMLPTDANFMGNVFGGQILAEIDRVAYVAATRHCRGNCVTASIDRVDFRAPVHVSDVVEWAAQLTFVGTTSMEIWIRVSAEPLQGGTRRPVGEAFVTMVALDAQGRPTPVPPLDLSSDEERRRYSEGQTRAAGRRKHRAR